MSIRWRESFRGWEVRATFPRAKSFYAPNVISRNSTHSVFLMTFVLFYVIYSKIVPSKVCYSKKSEKRTEKQMKSVVSWCLNHLTEDTEASSNKGTKIFDCHEKGLVFQWNTKWRSLIIVNFFCGPSLITRPPLWSSDWIGEISVGFRKKEVKRKKMKRI